MHLLLAGRWKTTGNHYRSTCSVAVIAPIGSVIDLRDSNIVLKRIRFEASISTARSVCARVSLSLSRSFMPLSLSLRLLSSSSFFKFNRASFLTKRSVLCVYIRVRDEVDLRGFERIERNVVSESCMERVRVRTVLPYLMKILLIESTRFYSFESILYTLRISRVTIK